MRESKKEDRYHYHQSWIYQSEGTERWEVEELEHELPTNPHLRTLLLQTHQFS